MRASGALQAGSFDQAARLRSVASGATSIHVAADISAHARTNVTADGMRSASTAQKARHVSAYPSKAPETQAAGCLPNSARPSGQPGSGCKNVERNVGQRPGPGDDHGDDSGADGDDGDGNKHATAKYHGAGLTIS